MKAAILEKYDKNGTNLVIKDVKFTKLIDNEVLVISLYFSCKSVLQ